MKSSLAVGCIVLGLSHSFLLGAEPVNFSREILPLLSDRCFQCHGPDETHRATELRFDERDSALAEHSGGAVIVPGDAARSELFARITSSDPDSVMPPREAHRKPFTPREIERIRTWIDEGATWGKHWAFEPPNRPDLLENGVHPIDQLVDQRLREKGLQRSQKADRETLIRRVSFDLTGLPPTVAEIDAFLADQSPDAYERVVDRLLQSPRYGERMAMWWLDLARYSDTDGFQGDATRTNWPWRDWVIESFNTGMPFDQFTIEQFAGDLLPNASPNQILATCFHRNHMTNGEGGRDPEESRIDYVIDRVNTTGIVWLGLTLGCSQCHDHKFDPISQRDYYSLFAFFDSLDEDGKAGSAAKPYLKFRSPYAERDANQAAELEKQRANRLAETRVTVLQGFDGWLADLRSRTSSGFEPWTILHANAMRTVEGTVLEQHDDGTFVASGPNPRQDDYVIAGAASLPRVTGLRLEVFPHESHSKGRYSRGETGEFILTDLKLQVRRAGAPGLKDIAIVSAIADAELDAKARQYGKVQDTLDDDPRNGWTTDPEGEAVPHKAIYALAEPLVLGDDEELVVTLLHRSTVGDANLGRFRLAVTDQPGEAVRSLEPMPLERLAALPAEAAIDDELRKELEAQFLIDQPAWREALSEWEAADRQAKAMKSASGEMNVMVMAERAEPRTTYILQRGVWDQKGEEVSRGLPAAVLPVSLSSESSRLDLARWLVADENPLTARVIVNQFWQLLFGAGLVRTPDDFGLQGLPPAHPEVLDWLALEFRDSGWDVRHVLRAIVLSETYQQSSEVSPELLERDPSNEWLARGARYRLPSWMLRDAALHAAGLLEPNVGGPPVMPYQPEGVWEEMFMGRFKYEPSQGTAQHRRTVYAFWRRAAAPTFLFDNAQRRVCESVPRLTNTPLHALTLLNDVSLLEAAREIARQAIAEQQSAEQRLVAMSRAILGRPPRAEEQAILLAKLERTLAAYRNDPKQAEVFLEFGQPELQTAENPTELAAYLVIASLLFNLDEAMTHE
ncbi:MAG: PSD1 domain-containing protein [Planctomycetaceae bacterium]|nr:PSD1 domain-containing protein [Planctomycetaceae bacterium]